MNSQASIASSVLAPTRRPLLPRPFLYLRALWRDKFTLTATVFLLLVIFGAIFADFVAPYDPAKQSLRDRLMPPTLEASPQGGFPHILGTDALGRDMFTRLIYGARVSLAVGAASVAFSGLTGTLLGLLAGYYRRWVDDLIMRIVDIQMGFPTLLLALMVLYATGPGFVNVILVLAVARWMSYARITRSLMFSLRETAFVEAARAVGCSDRQIIFRHMLPNILSPVLVLATLEFGMMIVIEAALDFLGLGIQPPESSWGLMLALGRQYTTSAWWVVTFPGVTILLATLSMNLLATWMRAVTDPVQGWRWLGTRRPAS